MGSVRSGRTSRCPEANGRLTAPPHSAFLRLLVDVERDADLKRLLNKYADPSVQHRLLGILRNTKFSHEIRATLGKRVSDARAWFKKRDRWRRRVGVLDRGLEALLEQFRDSIYPILRAGRRLPDGYSRDTAELFDVLERIKQLVNQNPILSLSFTTRGHQAQPYLKAAIDAMQALKITKADAQDLLVLIGVKYDPVTA